MDTSILFFFCHRITKSTSHNDIGLIFAHAGYVHPSFHYSRTSLIPLSKAPTVAIKQYILSLEVTFLMLQRRQWRIFLSSAYPLTTNANLPLCLTLYNYT